MSDPDPAVLSMAEVLLQMAEAINEHPERREEIAEHYAAMLANEYDKQLRAMAVKTVNRLRRDSA